MTRSKRAKRREAVDDASDTIAEGAESPSSEEADRVDVDGAFDALDMGHAAGPGQDSYGQGGAERPRAELKTLDFDMHELIAKLGESSLFGEMSDTHRARVARICNVVEAKRNKHIFCEGDAGDTVYVILAGAVRISKFVPGMGEEALAVLKAGSAFGEMSLVEGAPRSADAIAHETCRLCVFAREDLEGLMFVDRAIGCDLLWKIVRVLSQRLRDTNDKMTFLSVTGRFE